MIAVIDIGIGNVGSVARALSRQKFPYLVARTSDELGKGDRIIFPGVGSFKEGVRKLHESGIYEPLREIVLHRRKPILGICLGMQLFAKLGHEHGLSEGLGFFDAEVVHISHGGIEMPRSLHMGWNDVAAAADDPIYRNVKPNSCFYFVHGYHMMLREGVQVGRTNYCRDLVASVRKDNIWGTQFHPEKSQESGMQVLRNFATC